MSQLLHNNLSLGSPERYDLVRLDGLGDGDFTLTLKYFVTECKRFRSNQRIKIESLAHRSTTN
jgi:hypothetical protein